MADGSRSINNRKPVTGFTPHDSSVPLNFIILGDQGGAGDGTTDILRPNGDTTGADPDRTGAGVLALAIRAVFDMKTTDEADGCVFALTNGDNIYTEGVTNKTDQRFVTAYEKPFGMRVGIPFYLSLGNHDNGFSGIIEAFGDNQVEYTYLTEEEQATLVSPDPDDQGKQLYTGTWNMPARYYSQRFGSVLEIFAIDTDTIDTDLPGAQPTAEGTNFDSAYQREWINEALDVSPATWKMSFGHYNYISNGRYGDGSLSFKAALEDSICDRVDFHLQGHEHDLRWMRAVESCGKTEFLVSGAGSKVENRVGVPQFEEREGEGGISSYGLNESLAFMWVSLLGDTIRIEWYSDDKDGPDGNGPVPIEVWNLTKADLGKSIVEDSM